MDVTESLSPEDFPTYGSPVHWQTRTRTARRFAQEAGGLWELAHASGLGIAIFQDQIHVVPECKPLCEHFGLDPLGLLASGALLIAAPNDHAHAIAERLHSEGIPTTVIGRMVPLVEGCTIRMADESSRLLPTFPRDEIAQLFERPAHL
jgi:hydrogenase maturation factor